MRISIVTPHFNQLEWLDLCMASVADQASKNGPHIEHIIQDAGTPGIREFAHAHGAAFFCESQSSNIMDCKETDANCNYRASVYSAPDSGMYDAINRGFIRAKGEIVAWLNADEQYLPGSLKKVAIAFQSHSSIDMFFGDTVVTDAFGKYICSRTAIKPGRLHSLVSGNLSFLTASNFVRKSIIDAGHLIPVGWRVVGDAVWTVNLLAAQIPMCRVSEYISAYVDTGNNLSIRTEAYTESFRLASKAPKWARMARQLIIAWFRFRKLLAGGYHLKPFEYEVFTLEQNTKRKRFKVDEPRQRWHGR